MRDIERDNAERSCCFSSFVQKRNIERETASVRDIERDNMRETEKEKKRDRKGDSKREKEREIFYLKQKPDVIL